MAQGKAAAAVAEDKTVASNYTHFVSSVTPPLAHRIDLHTIAESDVKATTERLKTS